MSEGETGEISARTEPAGVPVSWTSSDAEIATVENGVVSAIAAGSVTITGTIEVDGIEYSDTCDVVVEANLVIFYLTDSTNWNNAELWTKQDYQETSRGTYIAYNAAREAIECVNNPGGSSTTLYADVSPNATSFTYDDSYNYFLEFNYENTGDNSYKLQLTGSSSNVVFSADGWSEYVIEANAADVVQLPLQLAGESASRFINLQVRKVTVSDNSSMYFTTHIMREPK